MTTETRACEVCGRDGDGNEPIEDYYGDPAVGVHRTCLREAEMFFGTDGTCEWFALCDQLAIGTVAHPVLGSVPTCKRCAEKLGLDFEEPS